MTVLSENTILFLATVVMSIIGTLIIGWKKQVESKQREVDDEISQLKSDLTEKFENLVSQMHETEKTILSEISKINIILAKRSKSTKRVGDN